MNRSATPDPSLARNTAEYCNSGQVPLGVGTKTYGVPATIQIDGTSSTYLGSSIGRASDQESEGGGSIPT